MRAVILTAGGIEHTYVTNALLASLGVHVVAVILESRRSSHQDALKRYGVLRVGERLVTKAARHLLRHNARRMRALIEILGLVQPELSARIPVHQTPSLNSSETRTTLASLSPTHLFVFGTGIVGAATFRLAPYALNLHTGLSPWYRGSDTEFWPLYRGEANMVGITVHEVSAALDGGAIYERASVQLEPSDDVFTAFARCVKLGGLKYAEVAGRLAAGEALKPVSQDLGAGRAYRFTDRTFVHDIVTDYRFLTGKTKRLIQSAKRF